MWGSNKLNKLVDSYRVNKLVDPYRVNKLVDSYRVTSLLKLLYFKVQFLSSTNVEIKPIFDGNV